MDVPSESFLHLLLWLIFHQLHPNFINVRTAYASEIWMQLTKNLRNCSVPSQLRVKMHLKSPSVMAF